MAYRDDVDALMAQCETLRRDLAHAKVDGLELERLQRELKHKTKELERLRAEVEPALRAKRQRRIVLLGAITCLGAGIAVAISSREPKPTSAGWFAQARPHCNPLEARDFLSKSRPPDDAQAPGYLATCWALGGHIDDARAILRGAGPRQRRGLSILFETAHPIADRGDDRAAGPIMGLITELWPENYMAWYHAGMSDYAGGAAPVAKTRLERFLSLYAQRDGWRSNAERALAGIDAGRSFAEVFAGVRDPRIE